MLTQTWEIFRALDELQSAVEKVLAAGSGKSLDATAELLSAWNDARVVADKHRQWVHAARARVIENYPQRAEEMKP